MTVSGFQKFLFRLNVAATGIIFFLLAPTIHIYVWWFPSKDQALWEIPVIILVISCGIWFVTSWKGDSLVRRGWFEDQRGKHLREKKAPERRIIKILLPLLFFLGQILLLINLAKIFVNFMNSGAVERMLKNIP